MDKGQKQWEALINMPDEQERNPALVQRAIAEIQQSQAEPKKSWFARKWKSIASCAAAVVVTATVALCIGIPLLNKNAAPEIVYYERKDISYANVENVDTFIAEKGVDILHFDNALSTQSAIITQTGELAFLEQDTFQMNETSFDKVLLRSVVKKNVELVFAESYKNLPETHTLETISIKYQINERPTNDRQVFAKFTYEQVDYYLDIVTELDGVEQLEVYVRMLLG